MKRLVENNVIKINYDRFLNEYKKFCQNEEPASDQELYEHFIINHLSYSRPVGCLPPNYYKIKEGYLKGINLFEIIEYVNISERMFKCYNDTEEDDLEAKENGDDRDMESNDEQMLDDEEEEEEEEWVYSKGKKRNKKKKTVSKRKNLPKKKKDTYSTNDNYNKCKRVYRFLLFDGTKFIYAYEDEFNENFNYFDNEEYKYPKILLYNDPIIRSGVLLIRKNQARILFKGYKTSQGIEHEAEEKEEKVKETYKKEHEIVDTDTRENNNRGISYEKHESKNYLICANNIGSAQPKLEKKEIICLEMNDDKPCSSYFKNKSHANMSTKQDSTFFTTSSQANPQQRIHDYKCEPEPIKAISNYNLIYGIPPNDAENSYSDMNALDEDRTRPFNPIANFDNEERAMWEKNKRKWDSNVNRNVNDLKLVDQTYNSCGENSFDNRNMKSSQETNYQNRLKEKSNTFQSNTNAQPAVVDLTDDFFNSDFFTSAVASGNPDKNEKDVILIDD